MKTFIKLIRNYIFIILHTKLENGKHKRVQLCVYKKKKQLIFNYNKFNLRKYKSITILIKLYVLLLNLMLS